MCIKTMTEMTDEEKVKLADRLIQNYHMELPPEGIAWTDKPGECLNCRHLFDSHRDKPAIPPGGHSSDLSYLCCKCGRRWWQYNNHFHLWKNITTLAEWDGIRRQQILFDAGYAPLDQ